MSVDNPGSDLSGVVAGRYRIERRIGEGGMATVYLAHDERHDSSVALKVIRPGLASHLGGERFTREIRITAQLQHPNILPIFDSGEIDGEAFYVMPFADGETLAQRIRREGPLPVEEALAIGAEVADALAYAHERGFVHRDVKPSNIMLTHGHAVLADFGIARAMDAAAGDALTQTGLAVGTVAYMSPEQARSELVDGRTDIYSLGCVLFEMLAGTPPFTGSATSVLVRHSMDAVPSLRTIRGAVPEAVEQVIVKALAKTPADRFRDAKELRRALRQGTTTGVEVPPRARPPRRSFAVGKLTAAAAVVAAAIGVVWLSGVFRTGPSLDGNRVLVLPLRVSEAFIGQASVGEDVATLIINALDESGGLRWIDGLARMEPETLDRFGVPGLDEARRLAGEARAAHFVTGSITLARADLSTVALSLYETDSGELVRTAASDPAPAGEVWQAGLRAANELLTELIDGAPDVEQEWRDREPRAVVSFLRGEAAFRRVRLEAALDNYRDALARDPLFALAAIRGAQAAAWDHRDAEAEALLERAMALPMPPRYADFARGYAAYLRGDADEAAAELGRTVSTNPEMAPAWAQLGETYTHLLPSSGDPDSLAFSAFDEARRLDPSGSDILLHLIEIQLRRGDTVAAEPLLKQFRAAEPDRDLAAKLDIMDRCVRGGPDALDWNGLAETTPLPLMTASKSLGVAVAQPACAMAGYRALLANDTSATDEAADGRRWAALIGLQSLLIAQGRPLEAAEEVDAFVARWGYGSTILVLDGTVVDALLPRARAEAQKMRDRDGPYETWSSPYRLWVVGVLEATKGEVTEAERIADALARLGREEGADRARLMEASLRAHIALAQGDSTQAFRRFQELVPPILSGDALSWDEFAPLALERLALARLQFDRGQYMDAIRTADVFDSQGPHIYVLFSEPSLRLREEAATRLRDRLLERQYAARLAALGG